MARSKPNIPTPANRSSTARPNARPKPSVPSQPAIKPVATAEIAAAIESLGTGAPFAIAVSGGADSLALMVLAADWCRARGMPAPTALTVDHGLRPGSADEAKQVAAWSKSLSLPHQTLKWGGRKPAGNIQSRARDARYRLLGEWLSKRGINTVLTGHTLDDQAETFLLRLARGSGLDGLCGMASVSPFPLPEYRCLRIARPLLAFSHARLVATLQTRNQEWLEDPNNLNDRFARVQIRNLAPALAEAGITAERIATATSHLSRARAAIEVQTAQLLRSGVEITPWGFLLLAVDKFSAAPQEVALRAFARAIQATGGAGYPPRFEQLEAAFVWFTAPKSKSKGRTLAGCRLVRRDAATVLLAREEPAVEKENPVLRLRSGDAGIWDNRFEIAIPREAGPRAYEVRVLGTAGVKLAGRKANLPAIEPRRLAAALPGIWSADRLVSAPLLNFHQEIRATAQFIGLKVI